MPFSDICDDCFVTMMFQIEYCPLHQHARDMLKALESVKRWLNTVALPASDQPLRDAAARMLAKVEAAIDLACVTA